LSPADRVVVDWRISEYELADDNAASHRDKPVLLFAMLLQVMGLAVLGDYLYVVYHKNSTVYMYNTTTPLRRHSMADMVILKWPRGMAASQKHRSIYVTDWSSMFAGRVWWIAENVQQVVSCYPLFLK